MNHIEQDLGVGILRSPYLNFYSNVQQLEQVAFGVPAGEVAVFYDDETALLLAGGDVERSVALVNKNNTGKTVHLYTINSPLVRRLCDLFNDDIIADTFTPAQWRAYHRDTVFITSNKKVYHLIYTP